MARRVSVSRLKAGMDLGIVKTPASSPSNDDLPTSLREAVEDVLFNKRSDATERLTGDRGELFAGGAPRRPGHLPWRSCP